MPENRDLNQWGKSRGNHRKIMGKSPSVRPCRRWHRISDLSVMVSPMIMTR
ncbi:hypothetical protein TIFTF001_010628 [Ficus carica]|uniref:Uncharacterized protein n=1 Tax=Ficus carica TaxID=3494 RepID=A0AA87ZVT6_FICCA|nr:hypothetical protein TIFTF001_010628 [Ficus carica]